MERNQGIVIAVVVAALALFGLKVWSDHSTDTDFSTDSQSAQRLARAGGAGQDGEDDAGSGSGGAKAGRLGERAGTRGGDSLGGSGSGPGSRRGGGSAELARAGAPRLGGGSVGAPVGGGRAAGDGATGGTVIGGGESGGQLGPKVQQKQNLVDFISQQPVQADLAKTTDENGEDVALKIDKAEDIGRQGGQDQNIQAANDGDGIEIGEDGKAEFPNYATGDAATISFQLEPKWSGSDQTDNALLEIRQEHEWNNRLELVKNGEFLRFIVTPDSGQEADISYRIADWQPGDQHDIRAVYGDGKTYLYVDGHLVGTKEYSGSLNFGQSTPMYVGGDHSSSNYQGAWSTFRNFTFSNTATP